MTGSEPELWHILDAGSVLIEEFASAFSLMAPTMAWAPQRLALGALEDWERTEVLASPPLTLTRFPLQRGYARAPIRSLLPFEGKLLKRMLAHCCEPALCPVICTTPHYAPLAERWPGPVIYYSTDLTSAYQGMHQQEVIRLDQRMCQAARIICPNSQRLAAYFLNTAGCEAGKITIVPNATRAGNVADAPLLEPDALPPDIASLTRPVAGVLGNLAGNMNWTLIADAVARTPGLSWVFVGPADMAIEDSEQEAARAWTRKHAHFTGGKAYGELQAYARSFDVAVLPYQKREPTYSGSSTRFYQHLAACRPMVATRGFAELLEKPPLLTLVDTADEMVAALVALQQKDFKDGLETARWEASRLGTWDQRARTIIDALARSTPEAP
ncbi:MAG TPA: glycosyltransferase [Acidobacteriaceae bacterium]